MERLPGFRDFYPEPLPQPDLWSADARQYVFNKWRNMALRYGFREYDGPPLEPLERSEEHTSELQSLAYLVCRLLLEKKKKRTNTIRKQQQHVHSREERPSRLPPRHAID